MSNEKVWVEKDWRKENPGLHMHYVKTAVRHLILIDRAIKSFEDCNNFNMYAPAASLSLARAKMIDENPAYADADEILKIVRARGKTVEMVEMVAPDECSAEDLQNQEKFDSDRE